MTDWLGCIEGYYGTPFTHAQRLAFLDWMPSEGLDVFAYAPKDDPLHRHQWRDPYPDDQLRAFEELIARGRAAGVDFCFTVSPGLDWQAGDEATLIAKLKTLTDVGCVSFGVLWDDVPAGGTELGEVHGRATAATADAVGGSRWWTVGTDYAVAGSTPYLAALSDAIGDAITLAWTGPYVVPLTISAAETEALCNALGRKVLLWENFPVNDGPMSSVLHIGPYPHREPGVVDASAGVLFNLMPQAIANRVGVACGARYWRDPSSDREATWRDVISTYPGLRALALASRSWVADPGPGRMLSSMSDFDLRVYLQQGCREGLDAELAAELEPWLDAWDREAQAMLMCLDILERGYRSGPRAMAGGVLWTNARRQEMQVFGIRNAVYPVMQQRGKETTGSEATTATAENLTDRVAKRALKARL